MYLNILATTLPWTQSLSASATRRRNKGAKRGFHHRSRLSPRIPLTAHVSTDLVSKPIIRRADVPSGIVKWFNAENGYGFIKHGNSGRDVFIHVKEVQKLGFSSLVDGAHVEFDIF